MRLERREPAHKTLDRHLARFAAAAIEGRDDDARLAYVDAVALMPKPRDLRDEGRQWVAHEQTLMAQIPSSASDSAAQASLAHLRGRGGRR